MSEIKHSRTCVECGGTTYLNQGESPGVHAGEDVIGLQGAATPAQMALQCVGSDFPNRHRSA